MIGEETLYGSNKYLKEAVAKETGFMSSLIFLARDLRSGWLRHLEVGGMNLTRAAGCELKLLPELVDGFAREVRTIGRESCTGTGGTTPTGTVCSGRIPAKTSVRLSATTACTTRPNGWPQRTTRRKCETS